MRFALVLSAFLLLLPLSLSQDGEWWLGLRQDPCRAHAPPAGPAAGKPAAPRGGTGSSSYAHH